MAKSERLEDLNLTNDEIERLSNALKQKEFRDLFVEYAKELQDPENRKRYEEEIRQMESQRGVDVKFITPTPGYVIKTIDNSDSPVKSFINICSSDSIQPASSKPGKQGNKIGSNWSIPYSLSPPRDDMDKAGKPCRVYDCVFHPDTYKKGLKDMPFRKLLHDTAFQGIKTQFSTTLSTENIKFPKLRFKGVVQPTMSRTSNNDHKRQEILNDGLDFPYPTPHPDDTKLNSKNMEKPSIITAENEISSEKESSPITPEYTITHRGYFDMQNYTEDPNSRLQITRPQELVVSILLPLLSSTKTCSLDVFTRRLVLSCETPAKYNLDITLPYPVNEESGSALFDKTKHKLKITLAVLPPISEELSKLSPTQSTSKLVDEITSDDKEITNANVHSEGCYSEEDVEKLKVEETIKHHSDNPKHSSKDIDINQYYDFPSPILHPPASSIHIPAHFDSFDSSMDELRMPNISVEQRVDVLSIVVKEEAVNKDRFSVKPFKGCDGLHLKFQVDDIVQGCKRLFYMYMEFDSKDRINPAGITVDVNAVNAVVIVRKAVSSTRIWNHINIGPCKELLEKVSLLPESKVSENLHSLLTSTTSQNPMKVIVEESNQLKHKVTLKPCSPEENAQVFPASLLPRPLINGASDGMSDVLADFESLNFLEKECTSATDESEFDSKSDLFSKSSDSDILHSSSGPNEGNEKPTANDSVPIPNQGKGRRRRKKQRKRNSYSQSSDDGVNFSRNRSGSSDSCVFLATSCPEAPHLRGLIKASQSSDTNSPESGRRLRKSVSFCEDVDVVNIRSVQPSKATKKHYKKKNNIEGAKPKSLKHKEHATFNKVPLSVNYAFDME